FHCIAFILFPCYKSIFQRCMLPVMKLQKPDKVKQVSSIKSAMREMQKRLQVSILVVQYKIVRGIAHPRHQPVAVINNGGAVAPGQHGRKKTSYFYILFLGKSMWYDNGVF